MANLSALTYEDAIKSRAHQIGVCELAIIRPDDPDIPVIAVIGLDNNRVFTAYRGTVVAGWSDSDDRWKAMFLGMILNIGGAIVNSDELLNDAERLYGCKVHLGFMGLFEEIWPKVKDCVETRMKQSERTLWLTGHSLGGALATLAAFRLSELNVPIAGVYTFGAPVLSTSICMPAIRTIFHIIIGSRIKMISYHSCPQAQICGTLSTTLRNGYFLAQLVCIPLTIGTSGYCVTSTTMAKWRTNMKIICYPLPGPGTCLKLCSAT